MQSPGWRGAVVGTDWSEGRRGKKERTARVLWPRDLEVWKMGSKKTEGTYKDKRDQLALTTQSIPTEETFQVCGGPPALTKEGVTVVGYNRPD